MWWKLWILGGSKSPRLNRLVTHTDNVISCPIAEGLEERALNSTTHGEWVNSNTGCPIRALAGLINRKKERAKGAKHSTLLLEACTFHGLLQILHGTLRSDCDTVISPSDRWPISRVSSSGCNGAEGLVGADRWRWTRLQGIKPAGKTERWASTSLSLSMMSAQFLYDYYCGHMHPQRA